MSDNTATLHNRYKRGPLKFALRGQCQWERGRPVSNTQATKSIEFKFQVKHYLYKRSEMDAFPQYQIFLNKYLDDIGMIR